MEFDKWKYERIDQLLGRLVQDSHVQEEHIDCVNAIEILRRDIDRLKETVMNKLETVERTRDKLLQVREELQQVRRDKEEATRIGNTLIIMLVKDYMARGKINELLVHPERQIRDMAKMYYTLEKRGSKPEK